MEAFGITTVGGAKRLLDKCNPNTKVHLVRATFLQRELKQFIAEN